MNTKLAAILLVSIMSIHSPIRNAVPIAEARISISGAPVKYASGKLTRLNNYICDTYELTAYCPCAKCCGNTRGITSTGTKATAGRTIAVDPRKIPYGSKVVINGHVYVAEDCGGAIRGNRIDIFFNSHKEALAFGRRYEKVAIIKN